MKTERGAIPTPPTLAEFSTTTMGGVPSREAEMKTARGTTHTPPSAAEFSSPHTGQRSVPGMRIVLAGGTGLVGQAVHAVASAAGHEVVLLVRRPARAAGEIAWDPGAGVLPSGVIEEADAIVSLNGSPLAKLPWTARYREEIRQSRVATTRLLAETIASARRAPKVWVSASAVGIYGDRPGEILDEDSTRGAGFLADVVDAWEAATSPAASTTRVVLARTAMVLGKRWSTAFPGDSIASAQRASSLRSPLNRPLGRGGALAPLVRLSRLGLGGRIGSGRQHWPWITLEDEARAIVHLVADSSLAGPVNLVAPESATATDVTRKVASTLRRPHVFPAPAWALRALLGDAARGLLLADEQVFPRRLEAEGTFRFRHSNLDAALETLLRS